MRVISGKYRGRILKTLEGRNTRPTTARIKEDMFNILNNWFIFDEKTSLDLFGGSGALSIEGLSRGIKFAYINDHNSEAISIIKENLRNIDKSAFEILSWDFNRVLKWFKETNKKVDIIYLDPPFTNIEYYNQFFDFVMNSDILNNFGVIITESPMLLRPEEINLNLLKYKDFKNKHLYLFRKEEEEKWIMEN